MEELSEWEETLLDDRVKDEDLKVRRLTLRATDAEWANFLMDLPKTPRHRFLLTSLHVNASTYVQGL